MDKTTFTKLPEDLVDCWSDNDRMEFLFSAFPPDISSKPQHWAAKMDFWKNLIGEMFSSSTSISIAQEDILSAVKRNGKAPLGFETIWQEMIKNGQIMTSSEYIKNLNMNSSWVGWSINTLLRKPSLWIAGKVLSPVKSKQSNVGYVCCDSLQKKCKDIHNIMINCEKTYQASNGECVTSYQSLCNLAKGTVKSTNCLDIVLLTLEKQRKIAVFTVQKKENAGVELQPVRYIKFSNRFNDDPITVTEIDHGILHLHHAKTVLVDEVENLYLKQKHLADTARKYVRHNQRALAKNALRQKLLLTKNIHEKEKHLDNIDQMLESIEQSKLDHLTLNAYKVGVSAHKSFVKKAGLNVENVAQTMIEISDMIESGKEISFTMAREVGDDDCQEDLETELKNLLEDDEKKVDEVENMLSSLKILDQLPGVQSLPNETNDNKNTTTKAQSSIT